MDKSARATALEAAYELLETPRSHLRIRFEQTEDAVLLSYQCKVLTGVELDESGINSASAMAVALGVDVPAVWGRHPKCWFLQASSIGYSQSRTLISPTRHRSSLRTIWSTKRSKCNAAAGRFQVRNRG